MSLIPGDPLRSQPQLPGVIQDVTCAWRTVSGGRKHFPSHETDQRPTQHPPTSTDNAGRPGPPPAHPCCRALQPQSSPGPLSRSRHGPSGLGEAGDQQCQDAHRCPRENERKFGENRVATGPEKVRIQKHVAKPEGLLLMGGNTGIQSLTTHTSHQTRSGCRVQLSMWHCGHTGRPPPSQVLYVGLCVLWPMAKARSNKFSPA